MEKSVVVVIFREKPEIIAKLDSIATNEGSCRSAIIRRILRQKLSQDDSK